MSAIIERLKEANKRYAESGLYTADVSAVRRRTIAAGQTPYAVIVTCSDSRVIPEVLFSAGAGELFVVRTAGNVIGASELASIEYALHHLHIQTVVVLGHTGCGAVSAALKGETEGQIGVITQSIKRGIGNETDPLRACGLNVQNGVEALKNAYKKENPTIVGAIYDLESGQTTFFD